MLTKSWSATENVSVGKDLETFIGRIKIKKFAYLTKKKELLIKFMCFGPFKIRFGHDIHQSKAYEKLSLRVVTC